MLHQIQNSRSSRRYHKAVCWRHRLKTKRHCDGDRFSNRQETNCQLLSKKNRQAEGFQGSEISGIRETKGIPSSETAHRSKYLQWALQEIARDEIQKATSQN